MEHQQPKVQEQLRRRQVAAPSSIQVRSEGPFLMFVYPWNDFLEYLLFSIMTGAATPILIILLFKFLGPISMILVAILVLGEAALFYRAMAGLFNKVTVIVGGGRLDIRYGPLPWPGKTIGTSHIRQLYVKKHRMYKHSRGVVSSRRKQLNRPPAGIYYTYQLRAIIGDVQDVQLLGALRSLDEGLYLEQAIEDHLGIADFLVPGSLVS